MTKKTLAEIGRAYDTDKVESAGYTENYERHFGALRDRPVTLLEIGVLRGGSLQMWHDYFEQGRIVGLDLSPNPLPVLPERARFFQGSQGDVALLERIARECAPDGFDLIIDDAAHVGALARTSFQALFARHLKPGGVYVVEDWGTGYWHDWPDGALYQPAAAAPTEAPRRGLRARVARRVTRLLGQEAPPAPTPTVDPAFAAHNFGMVGFVKELVDQVAWSDITRPVRGNAALPQLAAGIRSMSVYPGQAFLVKA